MCGDFSFERSNGGRAGTGNASAGTNGIRAIRGEKNVLIETSGFDATAGFLERAVRELGANRILFGSHLPSRSLGTELGKVLGAELTEADKQRILGTNFRQLLQRDET